MKTLYIFATSERPDVYINTFAYVLSHLQVTSIYVVVISEHDYPEEVEASKLLASTVVANIYRQLSELSNGNYVEFTRDSNSQSVQRVIPLQNRSDIEIYQRCLDTINQSGTSTGIVIPLSDLDKKLREYVAKGSCIFDVSALKKNLLVDVVAILLSIGFSEVYSFELNPLKKKQTYDQRDLYHNLQHNRDFIFRNLTTSTPVKLSLRRIRRWSARSRAIMFFTAVMAALFIPLSIFWKESPLLTSLNIAAMIASIGSYLFLLVYERK